MGEAMFEIRPGDFHDPQVIELLRIHLLGMHANSPACGVHALDLSGLQKPEITFLTIWLGDRLAGCGAIKQLDPETGELKSMRTAEKYLRQGVAASLLTHMIAIAHERNYHSLKLETGSGLAFDPAIALYQRYGFMPTMAFGDYVATDFNQFFELKLTIP
jgi:putative acetyltransferase